MILNVSPLAMVTSACAVLLLRMELSPRQRFPLGGKSSVPLVFPTPVPSYDFVILILSVSDEAFLTHTTLDGKSGTNALRSAPADAFELLPVELPQPTSRTVAPIAKRIMATWFLALDMTTVLRSPPANACESNGGQKWGSVAMATPAGPGCATVGAP